MPIEPIDTMADCDLLPENEPESQSVVGYICDDMPLATMPVAPVRSRI